MNDSENSSKLTLKKEADGTVAAQAEVKGILLHTNQVEKWKAMIPNAPERILKMTEKEQNFRHFSTIAGAVTSTVIIGGVLVVAYKMVEMGQSLQGLGLVLGPLAIVITAAVAAIRKTGNK